MSHVEIYKNLLDIIDKELKVIADKGEFKADNTGDKDLHRLYELTMSGKALCKMIECEMVAEYHEDYPEEYSYNRGRHSYKRIPHWSYDGKQRSLDNLHEAMNHATNEVDRREIQHTIERIQNGYM